MKCIGEFPTEYRAFTNGTMTVRVERYGNIDLIGWYETREFEGKNYRVPKNYDLFLTEQYGNYMQLPPESERINKHPVAILDFGEYESI